MENMKKARCLKLTDETWAYLQALSLEVLEVENASAAISLLVKNAQKKITLNLDINTQGESNATTKTVQGLSKRG